MRALALTIFAPWPVLIPCPACRRLTSHPLLQPKLQRHFPRALQFPIHSSVLHAASRAIAFHAAPKVVAMVNAIAMRYKDVTGLIEEEEDIEDDKVF